MKTKKRRKKLRVGRLFLLLLILLAISFSCIKFIHIPIISIRISGNEILTDQEIIEISDLQNYPSFLSTLTLKVKNKLIKNAYIKDAKVTKGILSIKIKVEEEKVLFIDKETNEKVTKNTKIKDNKTLCVPYLTSKINDKDYQLFLKQMSKIDSDVLCKMSEIRYDPNEIDKDRYYVYMNDGNSVYLTINKFSKINDYDNILENIGKQNGTLYLDYGDYFEVK